MKIYNQRVQLLTHQQQTDLVNQQANGQYLQLDFDTRQRSRFRATLQNGEAVGIDLPRTGTKCVRRHHTNFCQTANPHQSHRRQCF